MSKIEVDAIEPQSGTDLTIGASGDTITVPAGATFDSSAATNTLPSTVVTTTGSQTLTNKTINASQLIDDSVTTAKLAYNPNPFRNIIINGDMSIAQRGTSFTGLTGISYNLDRWETTAYTMTGGQYQVDQSTDTPTGFTYSQKISCTTAHTQDVNNQFYIQQQIEGVNSSQLNYFVASPDTVTLSFWVKANLTGSYTCALKLSDNGSVESSTSTRVYNTTYSISSADTWEKKTVTIVLDSAITETKVVNNGFAVSVLWWLGAGTSRDGAAANSWINNGNATTAADNLDLLGNTSNEWYITGVQLEAGTSASDFEFLPYDVNLQRCERYYQIIDSVIGTAGGTTAVYAAILFPTVMRASPSISASGVMTWRDLAADFTQSSASATLWSTFQSARGVGCSFANLTGMTTYRPMLLVPTSGNILFSSEL